MTYGCALWKSEIIVIIFVNNKNNMLLLHNSPIDVQKCWCAYRVFMHRLLRKSQTLMVLSSLAETRYLPPGWNAKPRTQLSCPFNVSRHKPTLTSQMRIVLSREPDAKNGPWWWPFLLSAPAASFIADAAASGAQAMHSTVCSWSRNSTCPKRSHRC